MGFCHKSNIETNLLKTLLPNIENSKEVIKVTNKTSSVIKVVFESDNEESLEKLNNSFVNQVDNSYFEFNKPNVSKLMEQYLKQPTNFLSSKTRNLLKSGQYDEVYSKSIETLYNPASLQLTTLDKDPYLLFDDFVVSNKRISNRASYIDGKYYDSLSLKIKNEEALSPDLSNKKISELLKLQQNLSGKSSIIYLAGTPIHSYYTSKRSLTDINIICILSTLMIIFLTYRYFKNLKLLLPIALSIIFGLLSGYVATRLWFENFQIITMVFSTTIIGIGIDYSYHYFFTEKINKSFIKNLSFSFLTTIVPFILLFLTGIELLKQVAVFSVFGLLGIYFAVLFIYPCFNLSAPQKIINPNTKLYKTFGKP